MEEVIRSSKRGSSFVHSMNQSFSQSKLFAKVSQYHNIKYF